jgi:hypothetical protein
MTLSLNKRAADYFELYNSLKLATGVSAVIAVKAGYFRDKIFKSIYFNYLIFSF